jgi:hypothetical protein
MKRQCENSMAVISAKKKEAKEAASMTAANENRKASANQYQLVIMSTGSNGGS